MRNMLKRYGLIGLSLFSLALPVRSNDEMPIGYNVFLPIQEAIRWINKKCKVTLLREYPQGRDNSPNACLVGRIYERAVSKLEGREEVTYLLVYRDINPKDEGEEDDFLIYRKVRSDMPYDQLIRSPGLRGCKPDDLRLSSLVGFDGFLESPLRFDGTKIRQMNGGMDDKARRAREEGDSLLIQMINMAISENKDNEKKGE